MLRLRGGRGGTFTSPPTYGLAGIGLQGFSLPPDIDDMYVSIICWSCEKKRGGKKGKRSKEEERKENIRKEEERKGQRKKEKEKKRKEEKRGESDGVGVRIRVVGGEKEGRIARRRRC